MKRIMAVLICVLFGVSILVLCAQAEGKTVFYLDYGNVTISDTSVNGYDKDGNLITDINSDGYIITQLDPSKSLDKSVTVESGSPNVELNNLNIVRSGSFDYAVCVLSNASATFFISGENHIKAGLYRAGIDVSQTSSVTIEGDGVLYATSEFEAGIGGGNGKTNGSVTINSGTIYAVGGVSGYSAGIGGGTSGNGGTIVINGGVVQAVGGANAAGIGGGNLKSGGTITINGGTVTAIGGSSGAGIGGGYIGNGGTITINGGSIKATAGSGADNIGNGMNCKTEFAGIFDSDRNAVYQVDIPFSLKDVYYVDGIDTMAITLGHPDDEQLHLFMKKGTHIVTQVKNNGENHYSVIDVSDSGTATINNVVVDYSPCIRVGNKISVTNGFDNIQWPNGFLINSSDGVNYDISYLGYNIDSFVMVRKGDINQDSKVNSSDALLALMHSVKLVELNDFQKTQADMNDDGNINSYDALLILQLTVG